MTAWRNKTRGIVGMMANATTEQSAGAGEYREVHRASGPNLSVNKCKQNCRMKFPAAVTNLI